MKLVGVPQWVRAICLLDDMLGLGDRVTKGPGGILGASPQVTSPSGRPQTTGARKVSGRERQAQQPERLNNSLGQWRCQRISQYTLVKSDI